MAVVAADDVQRIGRMTRPDHRHVARFDAQLRYRVRRLEYLTHPLPLFRSFLAQPTTRRTPEQASHEGGPDAAGRPSWYRPMSEVNEKLLFPHRRLP